MIFDAAPGELFTVRNVAALAPPYDPEGGVHGVSAALEFAVTALKVKQIVVMGHGGCGGIAASLAAAADRPVGKFIAPWVEIAAPARDAVLADESDPPQGLAGSGGARRGRPVADQPDGLPVRARCG